MSKPCIASVVTHEGANQMPSLRDDDKVIRALVRRTLKVSEDSSAYRVLADGAAARERLEVFIAEVIGLKEAETLWNSGSTFLIDECLWFKRWQNTWTIIRPGKRNYFHHSRGVCQNERLSALVVYGQRLDSFATPGKKGILRSLSCASHACRRELRTGRNDRSPCRLT